MRDTGRGRYIILVAEKGEKKHYRDMVQYIRIFLTASSSSIIINNYSKCV